MNNRNWLHLRFEGMDITAHKAKMPKSADPTDCKCPNCKSKPKWTLCMDINQAGFDLDKIVTIMWCPDCYHYSYVSYIIEHPLIDLGD